MYEIIGVRYHLQWQCDNCRRHIQSFLDFDRESAEKAETAEELVSRLVNWGHGIPAHSRVVKAQFASSPAKDLFFCSVKCSVEYELKYTLGLRERTISIIMRNILGVGEVIDGDE